MAEMSPMMKQYLAIKEQNKDCILMFRLGDFYEMFFDDAVTASNILNLVLTGRDCGLPERAPMCGVPYHSCDSYIARLVESGFKVAICEQMENPADAKGIVKREVVRVITPGTVIEDSMLEEGKNNYLAAVCYLNNECGLCFVDISTGSVQVIKLKGKNIEQRLINEVGRFMPKELLIDNSIKLMPHFEKFLNDKISCRISNISSDHFLLGLNGENILNHFKVKNLSDIKMSYGAVDTAALDVVLKYISDSGMSGLTTINKITSYTEAQYMRLDINAARNLELFETMRSKAKKGSLLWVLDKTKTAMGKRLLRSWLEQPLLNVAEITKRQNAVNELYGNTVERGELGELLSGINDIERLMTRIIYGNATGRELVTISYTASKFGPLKQRLSDAKCRLLKSVYEDIDELQDVRKLIDDAIEERPPLTIKEGGLIKKGYNQELDMLRDAMDGDTGILSRIEAEEKEKTGIKSLKVRYNKVFGYYIEISKSYLSQVPDNYIRKQTLTNCERFITDELKQIEGRILGAKDRSIQLEYEIFEDVRKKVAANLTRFQKTAEAIARLDVIVSLADTAVYNNYCMPDLNEDGKIIINGGRHPVVEQLTAEPFVANDTILDMDENRCAIITGPNMAGKSTYMRQVALICLLAQIGSFVPADSANIGIVDAIFTRVGASDDLSSGQSTFMVEMSEVADIIKNATRKSLLILDEIGRGTSTYDGMSIARAVLEYAAERKKLGAKTLFATHYHELTAMEGQIEGVKNYNIAVKKRGDDITFLRRIMRGGADDSYGIEVAKLSGIPNSVIERAKEILKSVESEGSVRPVSVNHQQQSQMSITDENFKGLLEELKTIDINTLTPIEALKKLFEICDRAKHL